MGDFSRNNSNNTVEGPATSSSASFSENPIANISANATTDNLRRSSLSAEGITDIQTAAAGESEEEGESAEYAMQEQPDHDQESAISRPVHEAAAEGTADLSSSRDFAEELNESRQLEEGSVSSSTALHPLPDDQMEGRQRQEQRPESALNATSNPNGNENPELPTAVPVAEASSMAFTLGSALDGDSSTHDVVQAHPLDGGNREKERKCFLSSAQVAVGTLVFLVLAVVGVVVGVTQAQRSDSASSSDVGSLPPLVNSSTATNSSLGSVYLGDDGTVVSQEPPDSTQPLEEGDSNGMEAETAPTATTSSGASDTTSSTPQNFPPFNSGLHFLTLQALNDPSSPQARANAWILQDPLFSTYDQDRQMQRFSMATLFYSTGGDDWIENDRWLEYSFHECEWYNKLEPGEDSCDENLHVKNLKLSRNDLRGVLPVELFFFPALKSLDLSHNYLYGTSPTMFAGARHLETMVLSSNQLTGQFTAELGFEAGKLHTLHNDNNQFTGAVPGLLRLLPNLADLNITGNQYTGELPPSLGQLSDSLIYFDVSSNFLSGTLPTHLGILTLLKVFDLGQNSGLRGTIPTQMSLLPNLSVLDLEDTNVSGSVPDDLCAYQSSGQLDLRVDCGDMRCCP